MLIKIAMKRLIFAFLIFMMFALYTESVGAVATTINNWTFSDPAKINYDMEYVETGGGVDGGSPYISLCKTVDSSGYITLSQTISKSSLTLGEAYTIELDYSIDNSNSSDDSHCYFTDATDGWGSSQDRLNLTKSEKWTKITKNITHTENNDIIIRFRIGISHTIFRLTNVKVYRVGDEGKNLVKNSDFSNQKVVVNFKTTYSVATSYWNFITENNTHAIFERGQNGGPSDSSKYIRMKHTGGNGGCVLRHMVPNGMDLGVTYTLKFSYKLSDNDNAKAYAFFGEDFATVNMKALLADNMWHEDTITVKINTASPAISFLFYGEGTELLISDLDVYVADDTTKTSVLKWNAITFEGSAGTPNVDNLNYLLDDNNMNLTWSRPAYTGSLPTLTVKVYDGKSGRMICEDSIDKLGLSVNDCVQNGYYNLIIKTMNCFGVLSSDILLKYQSIEAPNGFKIAIDDDVLNVITGNSLPGIRETITIYNGNVEDIKTIDSNKREQYVYLSEVTVANNSFTHKMNQADGDYTVVIKQINTNGVIEEYFGGFYYITSETVMRKFEELKNTSVDQLQNFLEENKRIFGLDLSCYNMLNDEDKAAVITKVAEEYKNVNFSVKMLKEIFSYNSFVLAMNSNDVKKVLENGSSILSLAVPNSYETYLISNVSTQNAICEKLSQKRDYKDVQEIYNEFQTETILIAIYKAEGWDSVYEILYKNNDVLKIDFSAYDKLVSQSSVDKKIVGILYESIAKLKNAFTTAVAEISEIEKDKSKNQGSDRSRSLSGGQSISYSPQITDEKPEAIAQNNETINTEVKFFVDLQSVPWAVKSINALYQLDIVNGKGDELFYPNDTVTREEFIKMLLCALKIETTQSDSVFSDVSQNSWCLPYIATAYDMGIIKGIGQNIFGIGENITRQDMAVMVNQTLKFKKIQLLAEKSELPKDVNEVSDYAEMSIINMFQCGIIKGYDDGCYYPMSVATRAEAASIIHNLLVKITDL